MVEFTEYLDKRVVLKKDHRSISLDTADQRQVLAWLLRNRPQMIGDIICDKCPEVT